MKIIIIIILLTISNVFYSCETTTISHSNPVTYGTEPPYFQLNPYIQYNKIDNRLDYGIINYSEKNEDSIYIRGTFYNNVLFRNAGNLYFDKKRIDLVKAEDLFNIQQLIDGFIEFGVAYYQSIDNLGYKREIEFEFTGNEVPNYKNTIKLLDSSLYVTNYKELSVISKKDGFQIKTNNIGFQNARLKIYNDKKNYYFYSTFEDNVFLSNELISKIQNGNYQIECLKGHYLLDTLSNDEKFITNIYSSFTFPVQIKD